MSKDRMREEFDLWIEQQGMSTMKDGETYYHHVTHVAWQAWKASRAAPDIAVQGKPVGRVKTVGGYPDESEHIVEWLCKYKELMDSDLLYATPQPAEQQPDVTQLVEALEACMDELLWMIERHNQQDQNDGSWLYDHQTVAMAAEALAAHRKGGDE